MLWKYIVGSLGSSTVFYTKSGFPNRHFDYAVMLSGSDMSFHPEAVYFGACSEYLSCPPAPPDSSLILWQDVPLPAARRDALQNLILLSSQHDFLACYHTVLEQFTAIHRAHAHIGSIFDLVAENAGLLRIANKIAEIFSAPISIIDNAYTILAASDNFVPELKELRAENEQGYLDLASQRRLRFSEDTNPRHKRTSTQHFAHKFGEGTILHNYFTPVYINSVRIGSFSVLLVNRSIPPVLVDLLPIISSAISLEMQKSNFYLFNKANYYSYIFSQLLDSSTPISDETFTQRLTMFGYSLRPHRYLLYADLKQAFLSGGGLTTFADKLRLSISNSIYSIQEDSILYLVSRNEDELITQEELDNLEHSLASTNILLGVSAPFYSFTNIMPHLHQAKDALIVGKSLHPEHAIFSFDALRLYCLIHYAAQTTDLYSYCYPPLMSLIAHDREKGSNLVLTLRHILRCPTNPAQVCRELFIHKNTLYYRMDKIRSIMKVDFRDAEVIGPLQLTFNILEYRHELEPLARPEPST